MPVEVRELIIRATLSDQDDNDEQAETSLSVQDQEMMITSCVQQVLKILEKQKQR